MVTRRRGSPARCPGNSRLDPGRRFGYRCRRITKTGGGRVAVDNVVAGSESHEASCRFGVGQDRQPGDSGGPLNGVDSVVLILWCCPRGV